MPSQTSLNQQQYYAHKQNAFWWLMSEIYDFPYQLDYQNRIQQLIIARVAVWDVLYDCVRPGSLDSDIDRSTEQANDIKSLLDKTPSIRLIAFNGGAAKQIFMRHCKGILQQYSYLQWQQLPSSSPAYAAMSKVDKLKNWSEALLKYYD